MILPPECCRPPGDALRVLGQELTQSPTVAAAALPVPSSI